MLDRSGTILPADWEKEKILVSKLIDHWKIGRDDVQVAAVTYHNQAITEFRLTDYLNKQVLSKEIGNKKRASLL